MKIGLDIDGTITDKPEFFALLTQNPNFEVHIITGRDKDWNLATIADLAKWGIRYDQIHYADNWLDKGRICAEQGLEIMFDDMDEYIKHIPEPTTVFKIRNGGNWSPKKVENSGWLY
jgi:uncharacterized HAD superfamily protein